ncbi:cation transporter [Massilia sp. NR 4-1]|uniref:cation transporter n=1 Tax=Massilia sp. NR 4-1 TaxID=1678028 RepID=UPI00067C053F|nr:cation transporter [Massilia sp. NR 4-1]AKU21069.1 cation transporter [Massilia sp. NR 4-1]
MAGCCDSGCSAPKQAVSPRYRRILWIALLVNAAMFLVELGGGWQAASVALFADSVDFLGDAGNYGLSLFVLAMAPVWRSRAALVKGLTMGGYGVLVLGVTLWRASQGGVPEAATMGGIGLLALLANVLVAVLLYAYRGGDSNMRSVWLCSRNDAIGNLAVMLAAAGVFGTGQGWPDIAVAAIMAGLGLSAARSVVGQARGELAKA